MARKKATERTPKYARQYTRRRRQSPADPEGLPKKQEKQCRTPSSSELKYGQAHDLIFVFAPLLQKPNAISTPLHLLQSAPNQPHECRMNGGRKKTRRGYGTSWIKQ
eukprot:3028150-Amphidinium_carterae.1